MNRIKIIAASAASLIFSACVYSQTINWGHLNTEQPHTINLNVGLDYGLNFGLGYAYQLKSKIPIVLNAEYSFPSGDKLFDDFKTKIGGQVRLYEIDNFQFIAKVQGVFRRYQNANASLLNFGSDMSATVGYYKRTWFVAGETGFDKAIVTHFKHSSTYKENFPLVKDGWYEPSTGGNFYYGLQTGFSFRQSDIYLKGGKVLAQDFNTSPLIPFYLQLGYNARF